MNIDVAVSTSRKTVPEDGDPQSSIQTDISFDKIRRENVAYKCLLTKNFVTWSLEHFKCVFVYVRLQIYQLGLFWLPQFCVLLLYNVCARISKIMKRKFTSLLMQRSNDQAESRSTVRSNIIHQVKISLILAPSSFLYELSSYLLFGNEYTSTKHRA